uniref:Nuclear receptor domain-containing protein n=1 Tax=Trichuris muris TaxID=70415 RepID=A0A5S6QEP0_TRIMR
MCRMLCQQFGGKLNGNDDTACSNCKRRRFQEFFARQCCRNGRWRCQRLLADKLVGNCALQLEPDNSAALRQRQV